MATFIEIRDALMPVQDPEIRIGILDLGLIYGVAIEPSKNNGGGQAVRVAMTLTSPACPYGPMLLGQVHHALSQLKEVKDVNVDLIFSPQWDPRSMASEEAKDMLGIF
ncbi:MAG: metal-sulfur cluster assembly factor [Elusimicrobia bacterium]|nr:metal-sulfur cluster assembly factor [Elusimicrobiota bacterium]